MKLQGFLVTLVLFQLYSRFFTSKSTLMHLWELQIFWQVICLAYQFIFLNWIKIFHKICNFFRDGGGGITKDYSNNIEISVLALKPWMFLSHIQIFPSFINISIKGQGQTNHCIFPLSPEWSKINPRWISIDCWTLLEKNHQWSGWINYGSCLFKRSVDPCKYYWMFPMLHFSRSF